MSGALSDGSDSEGLSPRIGMSLGEVAIVRVQKPTSEKKVEEDIVIVYWLNMNFIVWLDIYIVFCAFLFIIQLCFYIAFFTYIYIIQYDAYIRYRSSTISIQSYVRYTYTIVANMHNTVR